MDNPKLYVCGNQLQREKSELVFQHYSNIMNWKIDGTDSLLDIGCGPGDNTVNIVTKLMPMSFHKIVGVDISHNMIKFAQTHHQSNKIQFHQMNIEGDLMLNEKFDHAISFFCLQWVRDQE